MSNMETESTHTRVDALLRQRSKPETQQRTEPLDHPAAQSLPMAQSGG